MLIKFPDWKPSANVMPRFAFSPLITCAAGSYQVSVKQHVTLIKFKGGHVIQFLYTSIRNHCTFLTFTQKPETITVLLRKIVHQNNRQMAQIHLDNCLTSEYKV